MKTTKMVVILVLALGLTTAVANADFIFGTSTNLGLRLPDNPAACPNISYDGLELYFSSVRSGGYGQEDLWVARRQGRNDPWGEPVNLGSTVNSGYQEWFSSISQDGLSLYFSSIRPGGSGGWDLWMTTRGTKDEDWGAPVNLGKTVNSWADEHKPNILADGCTLLLCSRRPGGYGGLDIWITKRETKDDAWGTLVNLGPSINSSADDGRPSLSSDGLTLFFRTDRPGGFGGGDIYLTTRATINDPWGEPINLGPTVNTVFWECGPSISRDGTILYFHSDRPLGDDNWGIWQVSITPVVDLNDDGMVDSADMCIMVDHWGEDYSLCDIGPTPLGDGIVDVQDLIVLAEHLFEDYRLTAHWQLDETEGYIAEDSIGDKDGTLHGDPVWQPEDGMVEGALQFDGVNDFIFISSIPDSIKGPFSVFTWAKGGAPGQVVVSQRGGVNWLCADTSEGNLMTELKGTGQSVAILPSQAVITDGNWHRIGLVWDGSHRKLYVDGFAAAEDILANLDVSKNSLFIGTGSAMKSGTYWSGLIDDVRIYKAALTAEEIEALVQ